MKVPMSLEMWMQCGPSHVKCGCNVDPPHLHILKVDVMWSNVDVLWSNVDFHISNVKYNSLLQRTRCTICKLGTLLFVMQVKLVFIKR